jgi:hypothetical protein
MQTEWTKDRTEAIRRNRAIEARNRFFAEHAGWLGIRWAPMGLVLVPQFDLQPISLRELLNNPQFS